MPNIFSPRTVVDKNGVVVPRTYENEKSFDKFYVDQTLKEVVKKIGDGDEDFVIITKVIDSKRDIKQVINSQNKDVINIDESIKRFAETGDLTQLPPGMEDGQLIDYTRFPEDHAAYMQMMTKAAEEYDALPASLKGKMTMAEFIQKFDDKQLAAYIESIKPKEEVKEVKKDE